MFNQPRGAENELGSAAQTRGVPGGRLLMLRRTIRWLSLLGVRCPARLPALGRVIRLLSSSRRSAASTASSRRSARRVTCAPASADLAQAERELAASNQALAARGDWDALALGLIKQGHIPADAGQLGARDRALRPGRRGSSAGGQRSAPGRRARLARTRRLVAAEPGPGVHRREPGGPTRRDRRRQGRPRARARHPGHGPDRARATSPAPRTRSIARSRSRPRRRTRWRSTSPISTAPTSI